MSDFASTNGQRLVYHTKPSVLRCSVLASLLVVLGIEAGSHFHCFNCFHAVRALVGQPYYLGQCRTSLGQSSTCNGNNTQNTHTHTHILATSLVKLGLLGTKQYLSHSDSISCRYWANKYSFATNSPRWINRGSGWKTAPPQWMSRSASIQPMSNIQNERHTFCSCCLSMVDEFWNKVVSILFHAIFHASEVLVAKAYFLNDAGLH